MKKTGVWQVLRSACVGGWLTAGLFVAVDTGVWAQESLGMAAYDGMPLDAAQNGMFLGTALDWMSLDAENPDEGASPEGKLSDDDKENYTQIGYIESTRGGGQYIDTGYTPKTNTRIEISSEPTITFIPDYSKFLQGVVAKVRWFKIFEGETLVRNFVPVVRNTDGVYGLLDVVGEKNHTFHPMITPSVEQSVTLVEDYETLNNPYVPAGIVLQHNHRYHVTEDTTINASAMPGVSAIRVPIGAAVIIDIAAGKTLTLTGGPGYGRIPGGAGIEVPRGSKLVVTGAGTLNVTGGAAAAGGRGYGGMGGQFTYIQLTGNIDPAHNPYAGMKDIPKDTGKIVNNGIEASSFASNRLYFARTGDGGTGGDGGGGAGAGIGTRGGVGGFGGVGPAAKFVTGGKYYKDDKKRYEDFSKFFGLSMTDDWYLYEEGKNMRWDGSDGRDGGNGSSALSCGEIIIAGSVTVNASSGAAGAGGENGPFGSTALAYDKDVNGSGVSKTYQSQAVNMTGFAVGGGQCYLWRYILYS